MLSHNLQLFFSECYLTIFNWFFRMLSHTLQLVFHNLQLVFHSRCYYLVIDKTLIIYPYHFSISFASKYQFYFKTSPLLIGIYVHFFHIFFHVVFTHKCKSLYGEVKLFSLNNKNSSFVSTPFLFGIIVILCSQV